ncbi:AraC family ligand binding domain-containing protein, partial [Streptomyces sp. NPDC055078]
MSIAQVSGRERVDASPGGLPRWSAPVIGGVQVPPPYLLTTAVFDGREPSGGVRESSGGVRESSGGVLPEVHTHPDGLLVWPHAGSMTLHSRTGVRRLVPGQGLWVPPGTPHTGGGDPGGVACYTYVARSA